MNLISTRHDCRAALLGLALAWGAAACAEDLRGRLGPDAGPSPDGPVELLAQGSGGFDVRVEAKSDDDWIYLDLASAVGVARAADEPPPASASWDIALRRFHIKLNGGASGPGQAATAWLGEVGFDDIDQVPAGAEFVTDEADADGDGAPEYVMSTGETRWYDYNLMTHVLTPKQGTFVVRASTGATYYRFEIRSYYDDAGTAGYPRIRWSALTAPRSLNTNLSHR
ncbi:MAG: hypothetical protein Tsb0020_23120 [Haliangiales bacterium]